MTKENTTTSMVAKTLQGLEQILAAELEELGAEEIKILKRAVSFSGNKEMLYRCNLHLRTALCVLIPIDSFHASSPDELYNEAINTDWAGLFDVSQTFYISHSVSSPHFTHSHFAAQKLKDAICDHFRSANGSRPSVDTENPDIRINLRIYGSEVTLSLDSSGDPLFKRGYRKSQGTAPINEVLAAGIIKLTGWDYSKNFIDPMCGSGTFAIEAAMMALDIAPGSLRRKFSFMNWKNYDPGLWRKLAEEAKEKRKKEMPCLVIGSDIDSGVIEKAERNAAFIRSNKLRFTHRDFFDFELPEGETLFVFNPPYGKRMESENIGEYYKQIGTALKHRYTGCEAWIISSDKQALDQVGLRTSARHTLYNGPLECKLYKYELYEGTHRKKTTENEKNTNS